jgi:CRP-like cAMP-binding protein
MQALAAIFLDHGMSVKVASDESIFVRGSVSARVFYLRSGRVFLHSSSFAGREIGFEIVTTGDIFGFLSALETGRTILDATALSACELLVLDSETFASILQTDHKVALEMLHYTLVRLTRRTLQAEELALYSVRGRLARFVIALAQEQHGELKSNRTVRLQFSQRIMAALAGVSRETLNRQFKRWTTSGIVAIDGKELRILKPDALNAWAGAAEIVAISKSSR